MATGRYASQVFGTSHASFEPRPTPWTGVLAVSLLLAGCGRGSSAKINSDAAPDTAADVRAVSEPEAAVVPDAGAESASSLGKDAEQTPEDARVPVDATETTCSGVCNAVTPSYPTVAPDAGWGNITMYTTEASNGGACNYGTTKVLYFVAVNVNVVPGDGLGQWQGGRVCGQCVEVTALTTQGPQSVVVRIMDKCPDGYCGMDLGGAAPAAVMHDGFGRYDGSWRFVSCSGHPEVSDGPTSLSVSSGANAYWSRVQVRNPPGAVESMSWRDSQGATGVFTFASDPENTFEVPSSVLQSTVASIAISAHFSDGSTATAALSPGQLAAENTSYLMQ